jgi:phage terminase large subunit-like protein
MTKPLTHNRVDIKAILADPLLREELIEGATDFICKVEGIRRRKEDLEMTDLSPAAQAIMVAATNGNMNVVNDPVYKQCIAAALRAAAASKPWVGHAYGKTLWHVGWDAAMDHVEAIAAELEGTK